MNARKKTVEVDNAADAEPINHRTIVGRRRRAATETKIIRVAIQIFAERGPDTPVIEDFIKAAGIARGTFYNYFKSTEELLQATSEWLREGLITLIDNEIKSLKSPAIRFGVGIRLWMKWASANPSWSLFIARIWNAEIYDRPFQDIRAGIRMKLFLVADANVAWDVLSGAVRQSMFRIGEGGAGSRYCDSVVRMCLQALGVQADMAQEIMVVPLPDFSNL